MATTRKPKREKKEEIEVKEKYLTQEQLRRLSVGLLEVENAKLRMNLEEQSLLNLRLQVEIKTRTVNNAASNYEAAKELLRMVKEELVRDYGLDPNKSLSYDFTSGKILDN